VAADANANDDGPQRVVSRFIPLSRRAVIADLCTRATEDDAISPDEFARLALRLQQHRSRGYRALAQEMRECYLPFSPDRDTLRVLSFGADEMETMRERLSDLTRHLLERANYRLISNEELNAILGEDAPHSLRIAVDLDEYDELQLYARETYYERHVYRRPERLYLLKGEHRVRVFRRLFVLLKLKSDEDRAEEISARAGIPMEKALKRVRRKRANLPQAVSSDYIYIKVFKDIPDHDLEILFPLRTVQFRPFDKLKFFATAGGGTMFGLFTTTGKVLAATNPLTLAGAFIGFVGLLARQISKFFNQRNRYMMELAQKLFFHSLANNRAALTLLLDRAEEEDVKEDLIALYFTAGETLKTSELPARKRQIDAYVLSRYDTAIDFELGDAMARLREDGVAVAEGDAVRTVPLAEAAAIYENLLAGDDSRARATVCDTVTLDALIEA